MSILIVKKANDEAKPEPGSSHTLGISRTVYAAGYGFKDGLIWGVAAAVGLMGLLTAGKRFEIPGVKPLADGLVKAHNKMHHWFKDKVKWVEPAVVEASFAAFLIVGHLVQIPSSALGWKKAQVAIDKHEKLLTENTRLVEATTILADDNEKLKTKLMALKESRPTMADRVLAQSAEAASATNQL